jgi:GrpB-like predicted nucleotidyltransferase (UPF0157 family)
VPYDPAWPTRATGELRRLADALGAVARRLEHVGSTAVPGLAAKPIVDLQLSVDEIDDQTLYVTAIERLGYVFGEDPASPDYHFFGKPAARPRSHHLHVCATGSEHERRHLAVRDYLREHQSEASRYAALKRELGIRHPQDRLAYMAGKDRYLAELEARALSFAASAPS